MRKMQFVFCFHENMLGKFLEFYSMNENKTFVFCFFEKRN
jgi:hypothetical protein